MFEQMDIFDFLNQKEENGETEWIDYCANKEFGIYNLPPQAEEKNMWRPVEVMVKRGSKIMIENWLYRDKTFISIEKSFNGEWEILKWRLKK